MRFIVLTLLALGLLIGAPVFSRAQQGLALGEVNATIPGEGYQGWAGTYGGEKILQYCYFNRFLGEPYAGKTMYFEFKACAKDNHPMSGVITWDDKNPGDVTKLERIICGRWRVPHIYPNPGTYSANIKIENEACQGTARPTTPTTPQSCSPPQDCSCDAYKFNCSSFDRCQDVQSFGLDNGIFYVDGLTIPAWIDQNSGKNLYDAKSVILRHLLPTPLDIKCSLTGVKSVSARSLLFASTSYQKQKLAQESKNNTPSNLALASTAAPVQKNYPLFAGVGFVLLAATVAIGYIVRKLD